MIKVVIRNISLRFFVIFVAIVGLFACTSLQSTETPTIDLPTFTTEGKATKSVKTLWGEYDLYDPLQDVDVKAAFDYVFSSRKNPDAYDPAMVETYAKFLDRVSSIQLYDLARAGCKNLVLQNCRLDSFELNNLKTCPVLDFGQPDLNSCEAANIEYLETPANEIPLGLESTCSPGPLKSSWIGSKYVEFNQTDARRMFFN